MKKFIISLITLLVAPITTFATSIDFPNPLEGATIGVIFNKILVYAIWAGGVFLTILVVMAAYTLMLGKGDPAEIKKAKNTILYGIIGYVILLFAKAIQLIIANLLGAQV